MESSHTPTEKQTSSPASIFGYTWKSRFIVFVTTLIVTASAVGIGIVIARILKISSGAPVVIALIVSFPLTQYILSRLLVKKVK